MILARLAPVAVTVLLLQVDRHWSRRRSKDSAFAFSGLVAWSSLSILCLVFLWANHTWFPLHLDLMEGVVWQHFQRAASFQLIYPEPEPGYVPLAYNPLYYVLSSPFGWILGVTLPTLRIVAILGTIGCGLVIFWAVSARTRSRKWGLVATGLFAAGYAAMDAYLDSAHSDSWMLFSALLGTSLMTRDRSRLCCLLGTLLLVASFWFKQHGALFAVGGVLYLTWRKGFRASVPSWLLAILLGPVTYLVVGPSVFGPAFHYFTWEDPSQWTDFTRWTLLRPAAFVLCNYGFLSAAALGMVYWRARRTKQATDIWHWQLFFALLTGLLGSLDPGSSNNVYIPMGTWLIVTGTMALAEMTTELPRRGMQSAQLLGLAASFSLLLYNPSRYMIPADAREAYQDLLVTLRGLNGPVYAPTIGQFSQDFTLFPAAHWVALEDMIRGPGRDTRDHPTTRRLLAPVLEPHGPAYILAHVPLDTYPWLAFLQGHYQLVEDFGDRFASLRPLPKRWDHGYPRYLYAYVP